MTWFKKRIQIAQTADVRQIVSNIATGVVFSGQDISNAIEQLRPIAVDNSAEVCDILTSFYNTVTTDGGRRALTSMANEFCNNGISAPTPPLDEQQNQLPDEQQNQLPNG